MKTKTKDSFPLTITKGHASVKIYRGANRGKTMFTLSYIGASGRVRENFVNLDEAKRQANTRVANLAQGDLEALKLTGRERQVFVAAAEALLPTGISLDIAAREFATAFEILGHDAIIEAARYYKRHVESALPEITVTEAAERFFGAKQSEGMSAKYLRDIRCVLKGNFAKCFQCNIKSVSADELQRYMARLKLGPVSKNNHRRLIVALFNFAKAQGWLNKAETTAADALGTVKVKAKDVVIYTPQEVAGYLSAASERFLPWLALIAFGGIRREEVGKLKWEDVDFTRKTVLVPAAVAKTGKKRKIDMADNLVAWLTPYAGRTGFIFPIDPAKSIGGVVEKTGVAWKRNALRHSFGSYRMEATRNAGQVALEMGNSPAVVMAHYHECVHASEAKAYWSILPTEAGKVVAMPAAA